MKILVQQTKMPAESWCPSIKVCPQRSHLTRKRRSLSSVVDAEKMYRLREVHAVLPNGRV